MSTKVLVSYIKLFEVIFFLHFDVLEVNTSIKIRITPNRYKMIKGTPVARMYMMAPRGWEEVERIKNKNATKAITETTECVMKAKGVKLPVRLFLLIWK